MQAYIKSFSTIIFSSEYILPHQLLNQTTIKYVCFNIMQYRTAFAFNDISIKICL